MSGSYVPSHVDAWNINNNLKKTWDAFTNSSFCNGTHLKETSGKEASSDTVDTLDTQHATTGFQNDLQSQHIFCFNYCSYLNIIWPKYTDRQSDRKWKQEEEEEEKERKEWHTKKEKWNSLFYSNEMEDNDLTGSENTHNTSCVLFIIYTIKHNIKAYNIALCSLCFHTLQKGAKPLHSYRSKLKEKFSHQNKSCCKTKPNKRESNHYNSPACEGNKNHYNLPTADGNKTITIYQCWWQ